MRIEPFYPECPLLKKHIEYYYFQKSNAEDFKSTYYAFPNTLQALNIHKNIACQIKEHTVIVKGVSDANYTMILQGKFQLPLYVQLERKIDKVTIIFKPLGLNHFITAALCEVASKPTQLFTEWMQHPDYLFFLDLFYKENENRKRIQILENFLVKQYTACKEADRLYPSLPLLSDFNEELSIEETAVKLHLNPRTFNRLFLKQLGITPVGYRKIARFRHSLQNRLFGNHFTTLTQVGYNSNFYDQSYFIKMYKKVTGQSPSAFFGSIDKFADDQLIFKFITQ